MTRRLKTPRHILITGATSGLGASLARSYAAPGIQLALTGRDPARLDSVGQACRAYGATVVTRTLDIMDQNAAAGFVLEQDQANPLDLVIANAGISAGTRADGAPEGLDLATRQIRTNLLGAMHTIEPLLPKLIARRSGHLALISSVAGYRGLPDSPAYSASKAGIRVYGDALGGLLGPLGIAVSVIMPGFFDTPMTDRWGGSTPFMLSLPQMTAAIRHGLDRRQRRIVKPRLLAIGLQIADLLPASLGDVLLRQSRFHIRPPV